MSDPKKTPTKTDPSKTATKSPAQTTPIKKDAMATPGNTPKQPTPKSSGKKENEDVTGGDNPNVDRATREKVGETGEESGCVEEDLPPMPSYDEIAKASPLDLKDDKIVKRK
jgi:hypothetical protein